MTYTLPVESYKSARGQAIALQVLVIIQLVFMALYAVALVIARAALPDHLEGVLAAFGAIAVVAVFDSLTWIAATVVFLTWVYRAIANLPALGSMSCRFSPGGAVWSFFIPFVNLVRGHQVMATIWTESQPPSFNEHGFSLKRKTTIVNWWWGLYLVSGFVAWFVTIDMHADLSSLGPRISGQIVAHLVQMAAGVLFLVMVRATQSRQDEQWLDLERRRAVPQPDANLLR
jgi:hypothetical protein